MAGKKGARVTPVRMNNVTRRAFLTALSESSNVSASAKMAGVSSSTIYAERRKNPAFRIEWEEALVEGYARLEADLLAEALQAASGKIGEVTLKSRAQKHRLALALLNAHRASVKQAGGKGAGHVAGGRPMGASKTELLNHMAVMKERMAALAGRAETATGNVPEGNGNVPA